MRRTSHPVLLPFRQAARRSPLKTAIASSNRVWCSIQLPAAGSKMYSVLLIIHGAMQIEAGERTFAELASYLRPHYIYLGHSMWRSQDA